MTKKTPTWSSNFFSGLAAESVRLLSNPEQTRTEADFIAEALGLPIGKTIADVPSGDGRLSHELSRRGYKLRGIDISEELVDAATQAASASCLEATFVVGDMRHLPWRESMDGAFCFGNSFAYFDDDGNRAFLKAVRAALKPGARFLLQTHLLAESILSRPLSRAWYELSTMLFLHNAAYDPQTARMSSSYTLIRDGRREDKVAHYRIYMLRDVIELFGECGLKVAAVYSGATKEPFRLGAPSATVVATAM